MKKHLLALALIAATGAAQAGNAIIDSFDLGDQTIELDAANPTGSNTNSHYQGIQVRTLCKNWRIEARTGLDRPHAGKRAGGTQQQTTFAISHWLHRGRNRWQMDYEYENTRDHSGYSPLLENNRKRRVHKHFLRLEYARRFSDMELFGGVEAIHQQANLHLFNTRAQTVYTGLRKTW